jgi:putative serine protease PepD
MVSVEDLLGATRDEYGVTVDEGVFVTEIVAGSAAEQAGIGLGDVIVSVDGQAVRTPADVSTIIRSKAPGDTVTLQIVSGGEERDVTVTLGQRNGG